MRDVSRGREGRGGVGRREQGCEGGSAEVVGEGGGQVQTGDSEGQGRLQHPAQVRVDGEATEVFEGQRSGQVQPTPRRQPRTAPAPLYLLQHTTTTTTATPTAAAAVYPHGQVHVVTACRDQLLRHRVLSATTQQSVKQLDLHSVI